MFYVVKIPRSGIFLRPIICPLKNGDMMGCPFKKYAALCTHRLFGHLKYGFIFTALIGAINFPLASYAASQGTLGATSTGTVNISVTKTVEAQITDIQDMTLPSWSLGDGDVTLYSNVCVYSSTGSYKVTATGSGSGNAFSIASGSNTIPYTVTWNNAGAGGGLSNSGTGLTSTVQSTNFGNAATTTADCNGGGPTNDTARIILSISNADLTAAMSSSTAYTGTLTMLITPN